MAFEVINILTFFGKSSDVEAIVRSFNIDEGDTSTMLNPNKVKFYSDHLCPYAELEKVSKNFPTVKMKVQFADEDIGYNVGEFYLLNGEMSENINPKGGSDEAYVMSIEITGDDFFVTDFIYGFSEDDAKEEFPKQCISLAFKLRKNNPIYPTFVLKDFEQWAVEIEDYEFASEVSKSIKIQENEQVSN